MTDQTPAADIVERLRALMAAATPGPYRAHDHNDMMRVGGNPTEWIGYGWVGRITKSSGPNGEFDSGWLSADRRKDGSKEYRERASVDVHFVAEALNALPSLLDEIERLRARLEVAPGWSEDADGIACRDDTIALQDKRIEALRAREAELLSRIDERLKVEERLSELGHEYCDQIATLHRKLDEAVQALEQCDRAVSHGIMGDWSIALRVIRNLVRKTIPSIRGEG